MTGYTYILATEGETFEQFIWRCARAFVSTPDQQNTNTPISEVSEDEQLKQDVIAAYKKLETLRDATPEQREALTAEARISRAEHDEKYLSRMKEENKKLKNMLEQAKAWQPDHPYEPLKKFMLEQLRISIRDESWENSDPLPTYESLLESAKRDYVYCTERLSKQSKRIAELNIWLAGLRVSIP